MGSEDLFKKIRREKRVRKENIRKLAPYRYLIVCEGKKTEPNYFQGIKKNIDKNFSDKVRIEQKIELDIEGVGRNTKSLVCYVEYLRSKASIPYGHIWIIFDKDDFSDDQFNGAIEQAVSNGYHVGWSNEAIELWFLLHFEYLIAGIDREQYCEKLSDYFTKYNIGSGKYRKNMENIFEILRDYGDMDKAVLRSKKLLDAHNERFLN